MEVRTYPYSGAGGLPLPGVIAIVIFAVILALAALGLVLKCCLCGGPAGQPKPKKLTKDDIAGPNRYTNSCKLYVRF